MREKQPGLISTLERNQRIATQSNVALIPDFRFMPVPGNVQQVLVQAFPTNTGFMANQIRIPWRPVVGSQDLPYAEVVRDTYTIDLSTAGLATPEAAGGIIDGQPLAAEADYNLWAFQDQVQGTIQGLGLIRRPRVTGVTMPGGAGFGSTATISVGAGNGRLFSFCGRVLMRDGTTLGDSWNQGIITAVSNDTITVLMDGEWLAGLTNGNTDMSGVSGVEILQLDCFEPRLNGEEQTYNSGVPYSYMGLIQTDGEATVGIRRQRYWNEPYELPEEYVVLDQTGIVASQSDQICLGQWIPLGARQAALTGYLGSTAGNANGRGELRTRSDSGAAVEMAVGAWSSMTDPTQNSDSHLQAMRTRDASFWYEYEELANVISAFFAIRLHGYVETNW